MKTLLLLTILLGLTACGPKSNSSAPQPVQPENQLKEPSHSICVKIDQNQTDAIFVHNGHDIILFNGREVFLMDLSGSIAPYPDSTIELGGFCKVVVVEMTISEVIYE